MVWWRLSVLGLFMAILVGDACMYLVCQLIPLSLSLHFLIICANSCLSKNIDTLTHLNCGIR